MTMKKADRKSKLVEVLNNLIKQDSAAAYNSVVSMLADDSGLFVFTSYSDAIASSKNKPTKEGK